MIVNTWQACPICINKGLSINSCFVCNGTKLISILNGKPPKQDLQYNIPYNANCTLGIIKYINDENNGNF